MDVVWLARDSRAGDGPIVFNGWVCADYVDVVGLGLWLGSSARELPRRGEGPRGSQARHVLTSHTRGAPFPHAAIPP